MITFFSILFVLMAVNGALLIFSVNGAMDGFKKKFQKHSDDNIIKFPPTEISETKYKKAV
ncbi:hypothetical protein L0P88_16490 [Muricauda sp. SCSIO 64092]|uniref:hypothetical protein n=1 Tax=Allomuricauda sp. SCSIO 64092 TaxID=2908842 RepID=UPI001FF2D247|nr:hypothetical protein [Muricauda sp. SCSIO 64092]UOY05541.1 hypothetical protein L0P88_16490 [Muricauda sp. SCSIO 64092]